MQIAEQIDPKGITAGESFKKKLVDFILLKECTKVIETGTNIGVGTTKAILKGLKALNKPFNFISIEVNPELYEMAKDNNFKQEGLMLLNGLSVAHSQKPIDTTFNVPDFVIVDHYPESRNANYLKEVNFDVPDNLLDLALKTFDYKPDLVLLDSGGHMGLIEFKYLMERVKGPFILALDDTDHVKHYETMQIIRNDSRFEIVWEVRSITFDPVNGEKFGSAIIKVK